MEPSPALPPGWDLVRSGSTGETLFLHLDSLQCQRERPGDDRREEEQEQEEQEEQEEVEEEEEEEELTQAAAGLQV